MRLDLSFEKFTVVLAALGATAAMACGGGTPHPVQANEVAPPSSAPVDTQAAAVAPNAVVAPPVAASPAPAAPAASMPMTAANASPAGDAGGVSAIKPNPKTASKKTTPAAEASCGAGTCSGDMKKKIL